MKEIKEKWGKRWGIRSFGDVKNSGEEDELKKFDPIFFVLWWCWHGMMTWNITADVVLNWWG